MGNLFGFVYHQLTYKPQPLPSVVRLDGQKALVTGSNVGLGFEAARELAEHGLSGLILGVRNVSKGEEAKAEIIKSASNCNVEVWALDHDSFDSVTKFGEKIKSLDRLDIAILNAGVKQLKFERSPTGHESNLQVNHLATSLLSLLILDTLKKTAKQTQKPSRLTITSSEGHFWTPFAEQNAENTLARMDEESSFGGRKHRYYASKLLNVFWVRELAQRVSAKEVIINTPNPGFCSSQLHRYEPSMGSAGNAIAKALFWTARQGGHCLTDAATQHPDSHGKYLSEQQIKE
jgi:retinol dehydrogenase 12